MAVKDFLSTLLTDGLTKGYFRLTEIGQLSDSCCHHSTTQVIDFDEVKNKIIASSNLNTIKSCDGLKVLPELKRIDFIEFKGFKSFTHHQLSQYKRVEKLNEKLEKQVSKYDLRGKIEDSLTIWENLIRSKDFVWNNATRQAARGVKKHYIILTDIDPNENAVEFIALNLLFLGQFSTPIEKQFESKLQKEIDNMPTDLAYNLHRPILKHCNNIDAYYNLLTD